MELPITTVACVVMTSEDDTASIQTWFNEHPGINLINTVITGTHCYIFYTGD